MNKALTILLLFCSLISLGQSETHNFYKRDTTIVLAGGSWLVRIESDTSRSAPARPLLFTQNGQGEMGNTDTTGLSSNGPFYWRNHGWDGGIQLGNGRHYPILINAKYINNDAPTPICTSQLFDYIRSTSGPGSGRYIDTMSMHLSGLSQGAFDWTVMIILEKTAGAATYAKGSMVRSLVAMSGFADDPGSPYDTWSRDTLMYKIWAVNGGHYFGTEGSIDDARDTWKGAQAMNDTLGSAQNYFSYNTVDGGNHGDWDTIISPDQMDWRTDPSATKGPWYSASQPPPFGAGGVNVQGNYAYPENVYQWQLRQGDTALVDPVGVVGIKKVLTGEYRSGVITLDSLFMAFVNASTVLDTFPLPSGKVADGDVGFNWFGIVGNDGKVWQNFNDGTRNFTQISTDSTGTSITNALKIKCQNNSYLIWRADSTLWYGGNDTLLLMHSAGTSVNYRAVKISGSLKIVKFSIGLSRIAAVTSTGALYDWTSATGITPQLKTITGTAIDAQCSHYNFCVALIEPPGTTSGLGAPFVWGSQPSAWGGSTSETQPTAVSSTWGVTTSLKKVSINWNTIHFIDTIGNLYGCGFNVQGEIGNGVEYVNQSNYSAPYSWNFVDFQNPVFPAVQVGIGTKWKDIWTNSFYTFYKFFQDSSSSIYFAGRDKAQASLRGYLNNQEGTVPAYPNALDVPLITLVTPLTAVRKTYNFTLPTTSAGGSRSVSSSSTTLAETGNSALLVNSALSTDTLGYRVTSRHWWQVSGTSATIVSPTAASTSVTGLANGVSVFGLATIDNQGGIDTAYSTLTVTLSTPPTVTPGSNQTITLPTSSATVSMTVVYNGGATGVTTAWTTLSIPSGAATPTRTPGGTLTAPTCAVSGLTTAGTYVFQCGATDSNSTTTFSNVSVIVNAAPAGSCTNCFPRFSKLISH